MTPELAQRIAAVCKPELTSRQVAPLAGCSDSSVREWRRLNGVKPYRQKTAIMKRIAEFYSDDLTYAQIAAKAGCAPFYAQRYASIVLGICRKPRMSTQDHSMILGLRKQGMSMKRIAIKMGYSQTAVARALERPLKAGGD